jgi:hypothetical protein
MKVFVLALNMLLLQAASSFANDLNTARQCMVHILHLERHHQIPQGLLFAIAKTESGRKIPNIRENLPWPWAVNVGGKSFFFNNQAEAINKVEELVKKGVHNIDVGCMQINYHHHRDQFNSIADMFNPRLNVKYGAEFLSKLRRDYGSWTKAVGLYHSATLKYQVPYKKKVYTKWQESLHHHHFGYLEGMAVTNLMTASRLKKAYPPPPLFFMPQTPSSSSPQFFKEVKISQ